VQRREAATLAILYSFGILVFFIAAGWSRHPVKARSAGGWRLAQGKGRAGPSPGTSHNIACGANPYVLAPGKGIAARRDYVSPPKAR
jgi:hypothetical protein